MNARKIATSVPASQFQALESARRRLRLKRSEAVQQALALWLSARDRDERIERYIRGYMRKPDDARGARAVVRAWAQGLEAEDW